MEKLRIAGIEYKVEMLSAEEMKGHLGLADYNNQKIMIKKQLKLLNRLPLYMKYYIFSISHII